MRPYKYVLDQEGNPVPEPDMMKWARWFEAAGTSRQVRKTMVGKVKVSTVFLAMDHDYQGRDPLLFETWFSADGAINTRTDTRRAIKPLLDTKISWRWSAALRAGGSASHRSASAPSSLGTTYGWACSGTGPNAVSTSCPYRAAAS